MNDTIEICRVTGEILLDDQNVYEPRVDVVQLRAQVGMVFQKPNPFPKSIYDNIAYGPGSTALCNPKVRPMKWWKNPFVKPGCGKKSKIDWINRAPGFRGAAAASLCIARTIAVSPEVILMDEPCSALDPIATAIIEDLIHELSTQYSIAIVTHSMQQASRVSSGPPIFI
jgi:phosphate transport system ATP-binding protein